MPLPHAPLYLCTSPSPRRAPQPGNPQAAGLDVQEAASLWKVINNHLPGRQLGEISHLRGFQELPPLEPHPHPQTCSQSLPEFQGEGAAAKGWPSCS